MPESLKVLADIIAWSKEHESPVGYFAALYTKVGLRIEEAIKANNFQHPDMLRHLDVVFFNRYLEALHTWHAGKTPSLPWKVACDATKNADLIVLQHLLLAMNAHIDLDLGVATAAAIPKQELNDFKVDFDTMNQLLASIMCDVEKDMALVFKLLKPINCLFRREEDSVLNFSMRVVRERAWDTCLTMSKLEGAQLDTAIANLANRVGGLSQTIATPGLVGNLAVRCLRHGENGSVAQKISDLQQ